MKAELVPENGDPPIPIDRDLTVIGRREYCDIFIDHSSLSKRHCVLVKTDGLLVIRDLISTNGTKVKGQKVRWAALLPDDRITLGSYKMRVYLGPDHVPGPSELYRTRGRHAAGAARGLEARTVPHADKEAVTVTATSALPANGGFPPPSPLEVSMPSADDIRGRSSSKSKKRERDFVPPIPIVLNDSDEIIQLD